MIYNNLTQSQSANLAKINNTFQIGNISSFLSNSWYTLIRIIELNIKMLSSIDMVLLSYLYPRDWIFAILITGRFYTAV